MREEDLTGASAPPEAGYVAITAWMMGSPGPCAEGVRALKICVYHQDPDGVDAVPCHPGEVWTILEPS